MCRQIRQILGLGLVILGGAGGFGAEVDRDHEWHDVGEHELALHSACPPADTVDGIDISGYQHPSGASIDWGQVAQSKKFVIIKATQGTGYVNPYFADDARAARAHGLIVGAYHFLDSDVGGTAQANHFLDVIGSAPDGDLPPMIDVEDTTSGFSAADRAQVMHDWIARVEQATGRRPLIYSGSWYWGPYLGSPSGYADYPKAWSWYRTDCPQIPNDFPGIAIWQYLGGQGRTAGIPAPCDQDRFYGTIDDLRALARSRAPDYDGQSLGRPGQSYPIVADGAVTVHVGETVTGWIDLKNVGASAWMPGVVWLAPIPRDQASPFVSPSWHTPTRISTVDHEIQPGEVGRFELDLTGHDVGESILGLGWVAEGMTWFADVPGGGPPDGYFAVKVNVVPGTGGMPDPGAVPPGPTLGAGMGGGCSVAIGPASAPAALFLPLLGLGMLRIARRRRRAGR